MTKYCKNCKHYGNERQVGRKIRPTCIHPKNVKITIDRALGTEKKVKYKKSPQRLNRRNRCKWYG